MDNTENKILDRFFDFFNINPSLKEQFSKDIRKVLTESKALIAGGSILSIIRDVPINDVDIYVNVSNQHLLYKFLSRCDFRIVSSNMSPIYDQSFFRKNKILSRFLFVNDNKHTIDVMSISDDVSVLSVVENFDLSFCEVYYDSVSDKIQGQGFKDALAMEGIIKPDYVKSLLVYFNKFILKRIRKYTNIGYNISYKCELSNINILRQTKEIESIGDEEWFISKMYHLITKTNYTTKEYDVLRFTFLFPLKSLTLKDFNDFLERFKKTFNIKENLYISNWHTVNDSIRSEDDDERYNERYIKILQKFSPYNSVLVDSLLIDTKKCKDMIEMEDKEITSYLVENPNNFIIYTSDNTIFCYDADFIDNLLKRY